MIDEVGARMLDAGSGGSWGVSLAILEVGGADCVEGRVASAPIVDPLDPIADGELSGPQVGREKRS
jgi:hypothetical protein